MTETKQCTKCGRVLPLGDFHNARSRPDGHKSQCKNCRCEAEASRRARDGEKIKERQRRRYAMDAGIRERAIERAKRWAQENPDRRRQIRENHYQEHKQEYMQQAKQWKHNNRLRLREGKRRRQAVRKSRQHGNGGSISPQQWEAILCAAQGQCQYCGATDRKLTMDHFRPIANGGMTRRGNLIPCCQSCNSSKGDRNPKKWVRDNFGEDRLRAVLLFLRVTSDMLRDDPAGIVGMVLQALGGGR